MRRRIPRYPSKAHLSGQARIKIKGVDYYLGKWGSEASKREYARLIAELTSNPEAFRRPPVSKPGPRVHKPDEITVGEVLARWLRHARAFYPSTSREPQNYARLAITVDRVCGKLRAKDFDCTALHRLRAAMLSGNWMNIAERAVRDKKKQPIGWCRKMVNRMVVRIRTIWRWAELEKLVPQGSWAHLRALPPVPKHDAQARNTPRRRPATWEQVQAVLDVVPPIVGAMLELQWWTGMRPSELVKMRASDVIRENDAEVWLYRLTEHKNAWREDREEEFVVLGPECQRVLTPWLAAARNRGPAAFLFPSSRTRQTKHYTTAAYGRAIARACELVAADHFTPYQIRHAAKERIKRVAGLDAARAVLRQKSIQTTDGYGDARDLQLATEVAKKVG